MKTPDRYNMPREAFPIRFEAGLDSPQVLSDFSEIERAGVRSYLGYRGSILARSVTIWHPYLWRQVTGEVREIVQVLHDDDRDDFVRVLDYSEGATYSRLYLDGWPGEILDPERQIRRVLRLRRRTIRRLSGLYGRKPRR
jgi:hypothetical protein